MYFDAHTHAQFAAFSGDYREVIDRALKLGVGMVNAGTQRDTSEAAVRVAHEYENDPVYAAVGLHPIHSEESFHDEKEIGGGESVKSFSSRGEKFDFDFYFKLASDPKVVGIGECGLDYYHLGEETKKRQTEAFVGQIELARASKKPLVIHCRNAFDDLLSILHEHRSELNAARPGIAHFFAGEKSHAESLLDMGFYFTFGGVITFSGSYDETIRLLPMDRLLSETDAPYVAPVPYRGKRNEPSYVIEVVKKMAGIKGVSLETMAENISRNTEAAYGIKLPPK